VGLFLGPFSGNAVGGGGHGVMDPPPPGTDLGSGPRSEVDTINRTPLKLLRTTMNKHKPKFMKVVPPGQQRGTIAPPYTWEPRQRDDWEYKLPEPSKLKEWKSDKIPKFVAHYNVVNVNKIHNKITQFQSNFGLALTKPVTFNKLSSIT
jgi:hypothetical protein